MRDIVCNCPVLFSFLRLDVIHHFCWVCVHYLIFELFTFAFLFDDLLLESDSSGADRRDLLLLQLVLDLLLLHDLL